MAEFASWHHPDAVRLDFRHALEAYPSFAKDQTYVLTCEFGLKSAHLAELMHRVMDDTALRQEVLASQAKRIEQVRTRDIAAEVKNLLAPLLSA